MNAATTAPPTSHAVPLLGVFAVTMFVFPSDTVVPAIGAAGYPAALVGLFAFGVWLVATALGLHDPRRARHPVRGLLALVWLVSLASYVTMDRRVLDVGEQASGDRYLLQLAVLTGVALVAAECLPRLSDVERVLRVLVAGGAFCGAVAGLQFWLRLDLTPYLRLLPGFAVNQDNSGIIARAALNRVAGTAIHPIELGVVAGMLLPLAVHLALHDVHRTPARRWLPVLLIGLAVPASVSRSAILAVVLSTGVLIVLMPVRQRVWALAAVPFAVVGVFATAPGLISTLTAFVSAGGADPSVATRVDDYPLVERLVRGHPWFGQGGGTYIADNAFDILDNQYLKSAIELGLVGLLAVIAYFLLPAVFALAARRRGTDPRLRSLAAALTGATLAAAVCSGTFDSLSFPLFSNVFALVTGLIGACWRLAPAAGE